MNTVDFDARLQRFAMGRLQRTSEKRWLKSEQIDRLYPGGLPGNRIGETCRLYLRLLDRAVYYMYLDCLEAGVGEEARELLGDLRQPTSSGR